MRFLKGVCFSFFNINPERLIKPGSFSTRSFRCTMMGSKKYEK